MQYSSVMYSMSIVCWRVAQVASILQQVRSVAAEWGGGRQLVQIQREIQREIQGDIQIQRTNKEHTFLFWKKSFCICGDGWPNTVEAKKVNHRAKASQLLLTCKNKIHWEKIAKKFGPKPVMSFQVFLQSVNEVWNSWVGGVPVTAVCFRKLGNCFANTCLCSNFQKYIR